MAKMDEEKRRKFQRLNSPEMYKAVACLWAFGICLLSTFLAFKWGIEFIAWAIAPVGLIALFCAIWYYARSEIWLYDEAYAEYEIEEDAKNEEDSESEISQEIENVITPSRMIASPTQDDLKKRRQFYTFLHGVCVEKVIGVSAWKLRGVAKAQYEEWLPVLKAAGVVRTREGAAPMIVMNWNEALDAIANLAGNPTYWDDASKHYYAANRPKQSLVS